MAYNKETGMWEGYIYKIYNDVNDKLYIGQTTTTIKDRWHGHMSACLEDRYQSVIYKAMRSLGRDKFHIEEILKIEANSKQELINKLNVLEPEMIQKHHSMVRDNGYNTELGGDNKSVPKHAVCQYDKDLNFIAEYPSFNDAAIATGLSRNTINNASIGYQQTAGGFVWAIKGNQPIKPRSREEQTKKWIETYRKNHPENNEKSKTKKPYKSKKLPIEVKIQNKLNRMKLRNEKVIQYNSFGEIIAEFDNPVDAIEKLGILGSELKKNLNGENLCYKQTVIRYITEPFDFYPRSPSLQPVEIYDLQGNYIDRFPTHIDAEKFLNAPSGEIKKTLNRGGSCKGYLIAEYGKPINRKVDSWNHRKYDIFDSQHNYITTCNSQQEIIFFLPKKHCGYVIRAAIDNKTLLDGYYITRKEEYPISA